MAEYLERDAPPSLYAVSAVLEGEPGAWPRVVGNTLLRAAFLAPGAWVGFKLAGGQPRVGQVASAALGGSIGITAGLFALYAWKRSQP